MREEFRQLSILEADNLYQNLVDQDSLYGFLAALRGRIFTDDRFADLYGSDEERPSAPPSLLATALFLQCYDRVSDETAEELADYDLRWKYPLGVGLADSPFTAGTLRSFRNRLIRHGNVRTRLQPSLDFVREQAQPKIQNIKPVLVTNPALDKSAVKYLYDLVGDVIEKMADLLEKDVWRFEPDWRR